MKKHTGFTLIEVMIFLAISGILIIGIIVGTGGTIARHRYNDAVQDLAQALRGQYASVINPQISKYNRSVLCNSTMPFSFSDYFEGHNFQNGLKPSVVDSLFQNGQFQGTVGTSFGRGRSDCAYYGLIVTLGSNSGSTLASRPLVGKDFAVIREDYEKLAAGSPGAKPFDELDDVELLSYSGIAGDMVVFMVKNKCNPNQPDCDPMDVTRDDINRNNISCGISFSEPPTARAQTLKWEARIEGLTVGGPTPDDIFPKTLLIFRSPRDGTVRTYVIDAALNLGSFTYNGRTYTTDSSTFLPFGNMSGGTGACQGNAVSGGINETDIENISNQLSISAQLRRLANGRRDVIMCIRSGETFAYAGARRMIRIVRDGHNSSAVELIDMDSPENVCN